MKVDPPYLAAFYKDITDEIRRLREEQWRLSYYFVIEGMGVIYLFTDSRMANFVNVLTLLAAAFVQIGCFIMYVYHLNRNHFFISRAREVRHKVESVFGLHELTTLSGDSVLPSEWKGAVSKRFEFKSVVVPLGTFVVCVQLSSLYVIWVGLAPLLKC